MLTFSVILTYVISGPPSLPLEKKYIVIQYFYILKTILIIIKYFIIYLFYVGKKNRRPLPSTKKFF